MSDQTPTADRRILPLAQAGPGGLDRRAMLQALIGGVGAGLALPAVAAGHPLQRHAEHATAVATADRNAQAADYTAEFLDPHQFQTLEVLAERMVPGSTEARVAPFVDQLLAVDSAQSQREFLSALGAFDMLAITKHRKPWKSLSSGEQDALLQEASTTPPARDKATIGNHFYELRGWISGAYFSSEKGMRELGWTGNVFHAELQGCNHPGGHG